MNTIPSILELSRLLPAQRTIGLPGGKQIRLATYLASWRRLKSLPATQCVAGWEWYPMPVRDILHDISEGVIDRISLRSGERRQWRDNSARQRSVLERRVVCECRWCGQTLPTYQPHHARFCNQSCRQSHNP